ncbi:(2Fe-2S)-binding protein [Rhodovulum sp. DZ06]|uniref:(2Fe-2S)-binding protein n=1 Tax=Rhodovulum sp. DZ06 TaxID=3425126 RepID=UPI003D32A321
MIRFTLDGAVVEAPDPAARLSSLIADRPGGSVRTPCGIGRCGACTVLVDGAATPACLALVGRLEGARVETAAGVARRRPDLVRLLAEEAGVQCGYCAPGLLAAAAAATATDGATDGAGVDVEELVERLSGNLCRCSGYQGLRRALARLAADAS